MKVSYKKTFAPLWMEENVLKFSDFKNEDLTDVFVNFGQEQIQVNIPRKEYTKIVEFTYEEFAEDVVPVREGWEISNIEIHVYKSLYTGVAMTVSFEELEK